MMSLAVIYSFARFTFVGRLIPNSIKYLDMKIKRN
jgi:hypothetical protein